MSLQNVNNTSVNGAHLSQFVDPELSKTVTFTGKSSTVNRAKTSVNVVNIKVSVNQQQPVGTPECDPCSNDAISIGANLQFNVVKGDLTAITALRTELLAKFDLAITSYQLAYGLVPPASAILDA